MKVVISEKPSMGRDIARVLGATKAGDGYMEGNGYQVTWAIGHLVEIHNAVADGKWAEVPLPILSDFTLQPKEAAVKQLKTIEALFKQADEIINAGDAGREGELIQRYIYRYLKCNKPEATIYKMVVARMFEAFHKKCVKNITNVKLSAGEILDII